MTIFEVIGRFTSEGSSGMPRDSAMIAVAGWGCQREPIACIISTRSSTSRSSSTITITLAMPTICAMRLPISSPSPGLLLLMLTKHRPVASTGVCSIFTFGTKRCSVESAIFSSGAVESRGSCR